MGVATAIAAGVAVGGSIMANQAAQSGANAQIAAAQANQAAFGAIPVPSIQEQQVILQTPSLQGQYTPAQLSAMQMNVNAMAGVQNNSSDMAAQNSALQGIGQVAQGGFTQGDLAASRTAQNQANQANNARTASILNAMAQRGVAGSGAELAADLASNQQAAEQGGNATNNLIQQGQARSLQALAQQGSMGMQMNQQQLNQQNAVAQAQNAINQFNLQNAQNVSNQNVANSNVAQQENLATKQGLANLAAQNANQQALYNSQLYQTNFNNQLQKAGGVAQANTAVGNAQANSANSQAGMYSGIAGALTNGIMAGQNNNGQATPSTININTGTAGGAAGATTAANSTPDEDEQAYYDPQNYGY